MDHCLSSLSQIAHCPYFQQPVALAFAAVDTAGQELDAVAAAELVTVAAEPAAVADLAI